MARRFRDPKLDRLRELDLFRDCSGRQLRAAARLLDEVTRPAGTILARAGCRASQVLFVTDGRTAARDGQRAGHLERAIGQASVETSRPHEHTVVAETDVELLATDVRSYKALVDVIPALRAERHPSTATEPTPRVRALAYD